MSWFFLAIIPPALWAATNHIDKFLLSNYFKNSGFGPLALFSSLTCFLTLPFLVYFYPDTLSIPVRQAGGLVLIGAVSLCALLLYYWAIEKEDASVVIPIYQLGPVATFILAYLFLGETLGSRQLIAFFVILSGALLISLDLDEKFRVKGATLAKILAACVIYAFYGVAFKKLAIAEGYGPAMFWTQVGLGLGGLILLLAVRSYRREFVLALRQNNYKIIGLNLVNEVLNTGAVFIINYCVLLAPIALVYIVSSFQSVFVFIFGIILTFLLPHINQESLAKKHLAQRIAAIAIIVFGSYLLYRN